jgi:ADP-ribosyl-[dinitrogen reductase] hydrolase
LLMSDGEANAGITDVEELGVHARELAGRGVSTSTFGVGRHFNEQLMEVMANNGGGNFTYIVSPVDIPDIFAREFKEMMDITARDVEISISAPLSVALTPLGQWRSEKAAPGVERIFLGSLSGSQTKSLYCDLQFPPGDEGQPATLEVTALGRSEAGDIMETRASLVFTYAAAAAVQAAEVDQSLLERAALARISHVSAESLKMERKGMAPMAAQMLSEAIDQNNSYLDPASRQTYQSMAQRMREGMDEDDRKRSHYQAYLHKRQRVDEVFQARTGNGGSRSQALLEQLLQEGTVRVRAAGALNPAPVMLAAPFTFDKVEGMLLGLAVGDALGSTGQGRLPAERHGIWGEITDYLPHPAAGGQAVGLPSQATQLAFWTVEVLLQDGCLNPDALAHRFTQERIFEIGATVRGFMRAYKDLGQGWRRSGQESAGSGAVARIAPVLLPFLRQPSVDLWADAVLAGMVTHNDYASNAACAATAGILWELLSMQTPPHPEWWAESFYRLASRLEGKTMYPARMPGLAYRGPVADFVRQETKKAIQGNWTTLQAGETWGSGGYLLETLPTAVYILARYGHDPEQAIIRAVNDTKDSASVAAIVGAAVGALHGKQALPQRWLAGLLGRTSSHNDGHIFGLIAEVKRRYWA